MSNNSHKSNADINQAVVRILYGKPFNLPKMSATHKMTNILVKGNIKEAREIYEKYQNDARYDFSEKSINSLGYLLLKEAYFEEAINVFQWNVERFPESPNVYDSLGEAYLKNGDTEEAFGFLQKSVFYGWVKS